MGLSEAQKARAEASKAKALAIQGKKKAMKQQSMLSFFSPVGQQAAASRPAKSATPVAQSKSKLVEKAAADSAPDDPPQKKLEFKSPPADKDSAAAAAGSSSIAAAAAAAASPAAGASGNAAKAPPPSDSAARKRKVVISDNDDDDDDVDDAVLATVEAAVAPAAASMPAAAAAQADSEAARGGRRRASRPVNYAVDVDSDDDDEADGVGAAPKAAAAAKKKKTAKPKKRRLRRGSDDDSEDEYRPDDAEAAAASAEEDDALMELDLAAVAGKDNVDDDDDIDDDDVVVPTPKAAKPKSKAKSALWGLARDSPAPRKKAAASPRPSSASKPAASGSSSGGKKDENVLRYEWLVDIRDASGKREGEPGYDPSTLKMPKKRMIKGKGFWMRTVNGVEKPLTPFEMQYWEIKARMWDTVLFFRKGKFYELYETDADVGHKELGLKISDRVNMKMAGVPEKTFVEYAGKLIGLGFKVAKADEAETSLAKKMREQDAGKKDAAKIITRELAAVYTQGTLSGEFLVGDHSRFILALTESASTPRRFGVCFADVGTAEISLCGFDDDPALTQLETLLVQIRPRELVLPKGDLSPATRRLLKLHSAGVAVNRLPAGATGEEGTFWDAETTLYQLEKGDYFASGGGGDVADGAAAAAGGGGDTRSGWPTALRASAGHDETMSALGGLTSYFRTLKMDASVISQARFEQYDPLHDGGTLMLDGQTLQNLEVLGNGDNGGAAGTVLELLCHCKSGFGKRLFRKWLCHPLRAVADIDARYAVVDELSANRDFADELLDLLGGLPDLERDISQIHVGACKVAGFLKTLDAFERVWKVFDGSLRRQAERVESSELRRLVTVGERFPDLGERLEYFHGAFDREAARTDGVIEPTRGMVPEFDANEDEIERIEAELESLLKGYKRELGLSGLSFYHPGVSKEQYQIAVPVAAVKKVPDSWRYLTAVKSHKRYWSPEVEALQEPLAMAKETRQQLLRGSLTTFLKTFDDTLDLWSSATRCLAELDCLLSLATAKAVMGEPMCRPTLVRPGDGPAELSVKQLRHPCLEHSGAVSDYIPNNTALGGDAATAMVLTGPNMGGKSTLLRQTCIAVIMAQLGAYVPAESMRLTPVDRIFTRIGANDDIVAGRSTFMVELKETATILNHATSRSLVILDELGRGTATFDGTAIAHATLQYLLDRVKCRTLFATHYHSLTHDFSEHPGVSLQHMACRVEENRRDVTFLYQLAPGVCSKSYGLNVANMAGLSAKIVNCAERMAAEFAVTTASSQPPKVVALRRLCELLDRGDLTDEAAQKILSLLPELQH